MYIYIYTRLSVYLVLLQAARQSGAAPTRDSGKTQGFYSKLLEHITHDEGRRTLKVTTLQGLDYQAPQHLHDYLYTHRMVTDVTPAPSTIPLSMLREWGQDNAPSPARHPPPQARDVWRRVGEQG